MTRSVPLLVLLAILAHVEHVSAQTSLLAPPPTPIPEVGVSLGWWRVSGAGADTEIKRRTWSAQVSESGLTLEGLWAKEDGVNPGLLGLLAFSSIESGNRLVAFEVGLGLGAFSYRADQRAAIAASCARTEGCLFEGEGIATGWAAIGAVRTATHVLLGRVSVGPWLVRTVKPFGHGGPEGKHGPGGQGWEVRVRLR